MSRMHPADEQATLDLNATAESGHIRRLSDRIFLLTLALFLLGFGIAIYLLPQESFSEQENRALQTAPALSLRVLTDNDFSTDIADFYADQFPARSAFVSLKTLSEMSLLRYENNGVLIGKSGYLRADGSSGQVACDVCMWSCLCAEKEMHFRNEIRGFYRIHPGQETKERQNLFAGEYERLRDNFLMEHSSVAKKIVAGNGFSISAGEKLIAAAICGIKFIRASSFAEQYFYVDAATRILPDDYGANEYKIKLLLSYGKRDEALKQLVVMLAGHSDKLYVKSVVLKELCQFFKDDHETAALLSGIYNNTIQNFFFMTSDQKKLLQETIDKAKSYL